jgi:hypothetical protein
MYQSNCGNMGGTLHMPVYESVSDVMKQDCINVALIQRAEVGLLLPRAFPGKRYEWDCFTEVVMAIGRPIWSDDAGETEIRAIVPHQPMVNQQAMNFCDSPRCRSAIFLWN